MWAYSPLVHMPEEGLLPFYRKLLDINYDESVVGRLSTHEDTVFLAKALTTEGCSLRAFVTMVAELAGDGCDVPFCCIRCQQLRAHLHHAAHRNLSPKPPKRS